MRIGDVLYFAPGIPLSQVDLSGPRCGTQLPEQFKRRMAGFYVEPAEQCAQGGHAFAAGVLLVSCIDALARLRFGGEVGKRFQKFACEALRSFSDDALAKRFYEEFRNGLVHEGRLKNGAQFSLQTRATVEPVDGILLVNPTYLAAEVRSALDAYVALATRDGAECGRLGAALWHDLEDDFRLVEA